MASDVDSISTALQTKITGDELLIHQYATHPELAAKPSDHRFDLAAKATRRA